MRATRISPSLAWGDLPLVCTSRPVAGTTLMHALANALPLFRCHITKTIAKFLSAVGTHVTEAVKISANTILFGGRQVTIGLIALADQVSTLAR